MEERYQVSIIKGDKEDHYPFTRLENAYEFYCSVKSQPAEVALHDLERQVTITDNTYGV
jgi:hypothetical protein